MSGPPGPFDQWRAVLSCLVLDSSETAVLGALVLHARAETGWEAWPAHKRLTIYTKLSRSTVKRALKRLEEKGLVRIQRRWLNPEFEDHGYAKRQEDGTYERQYLYERPDTESPERATNLYTIDWQRLCDLPSHKNFAKKL
jgi:predicted transcriptional regulator